MKTYILNENQINYLIDLNAELVKVTGYEIKARQANEKFGGESVADEYASEATRIQDQIDDLLFSTKVEV